MLIFYLLCFAAVLIKFTYYDQMMLKNKNCAWCIITIYIQVIIIIIIITSTSDLQPSTAIANQLPGQ